MTGGSIGGLEGASDACSVPVLLRGSACGVGVRALAVDELRGRRLVEEEADSALCRLAAGGRRGEDGTGESRLRDRRDLLGRRNDFIGDFVGEEVVGLWRGVLTETSSYSVERRLGPRELCCGERCSRR